eukprot:6536686-Pyramimonas_sp.AAC.1
MATVQADADALASRVIPAQICSVASPVGLVTAVRNASFSWGGASSQSSIVPQIDAPAVRPSNMCRSRASWRQSLCPG